MATQKSAAGAAPTKSAGSDSKWFAVPGPVARLFKKVPLVTYPANDLPARSLPATASTLPTLYVFATEQDALLGLPSFNPACLKWQAFLRLAGVQFRLFPSNNHASPTGALPFLLPASTTPLDRRPPIPSNKLEQYALDHQNSARGDDAEPKPTLDPNTEDLRLEAYQSILDQRIRNAWLYAFYLSPANAHLPWDLYVTAASSSFAVRASSASTLRSAAQAEITRSTGRPAVQPGKLYAEAREGFEALDTFLEEEMIGNDAPWFSGEEEPGLFDCAIFAYTHLILSHDETEKKGAGVLAWKDCKLRDMLEEFPLLVAHQKKLLERCWG